MRPAAARARLRRQHLPQQHAERVAVGGRAEHAPRQHLRRLVGERAAHCLDGDAGKRRPLRAPKVRHLRAEAGDERVSARQGSCAPGPGGAQPPARHQASVAGLQRRCVLLAGSERSNAVLGCRAPTPASSAQRTLGAAGHTAGRVQAQGLQLSSTTCCPSILRVKRAPGKRCEGRGVHRLRAASPDTDSSPAQQARNSKALHARPCALQGARLGTQRAHAQHPARAAGARPGEQHVAGRKVAMHLPAASASAPRAWLFASPSRLTRAARTELSNARSAVVPLSTDSGPALSLSPKRGNKIVLR